MAHVTFFQFTFRSATTLSAITIAMNEKNGCSKGSTILEKLSAIVSLPQTYIQANGKTKQMTGSHYSYFFPGVQSRTLSSIVAVTKSYSLILQFWIFVEKDEQFLKELLQYESILTSKTSLSLATDKSGSAAGLYVRDSFGKIVPFASSWFSQLVGGQEDSVERFKTFHRDYAMKASSEETPLSASYINCAYHLYVYKIIVAKSQVHQLTF